MSAIRFLKRKEVDEQKWNAVINRSTNSLPYALSWYLDAVSEHWDALVMNDYQMVMPLVWLRKWGIKCLYQPYFCQQLGFFHSGSLDMKAAEECLQYIKKNFPYTDANLNPGAEELTTKFSLRNKKNLLLSLRKEYQQLKRAYSENHKRNIAKAVKSGLRIIEVEADVFCTFYTKQIQERQTSFKAKHAQLLQKLASEILKNNSGRIVAVINQEGTICSAALLVFHHDRVINIAQATSNAGRNTGAAHFLFNQIIQQYAGSEKILDFEGSSIPSIARFYEGFGAEPEIFYHFKTNILKRAAV